MFGAGEDWGHTDAALKMRVRWVLKLRGVLEPFANGTAQLEDRLRALKVLDETKEWLGDWAKE